MSLVGVVKILALDWFIFCPGILPLAELFWRLLATNMSALVEFTLRFKLAPINPIALLSLLLPLKQNSNTSLLASTL